MKFSYAEYKKMLEEDQKITQQMIDDGELTEEEGYFRDQMRKDEILDMFE